MAGLPTSTLRREYAPGCSSKGNLYIPAYTALDACFKKWGYRPEAHQSGAYNCRSITGGTGLSLHAFGPGDHFTFWNGVRFRVSLATDINWNDNPYGSVLRTNMPIAMVQAIEAIRTNSGAVLWRWGGRYRNNKDAMHYEIVCSEASLRSGINWNTVPGYKKPYARPWKAVFRGDTNRTVYSRGGPDNAVWEIQLRLQALGLYSGKIDGIYGAKSAAGIRQFKRNHIGLQRYTGQPTWPNDDEIVGIRTINGLKWWNSHQ